MTCSQYSTSVCNDKNDASIYVKITLSIDLRSMCYQYLSHYIDRLNSYLQQVLSCKHQMYIAINLIMLLQLVTHSVAIERCPFFVVRRQNLNLSCITFRYYRHIYIRCERISYCSFSLTVSNGRVLVLLVFFFFYSYSSANQLSLHISAPFWSRGLKF